MTPSLESKNDKPKRYMIRRYYNNSINNINNDINIYDKTEIENTNNNQKKNEISFNRRLYHRYKKKDKNETRNELKSFLLKIYIYFIAFI